MKNGPLQTAYTYGSSDMRSLVANDLPVKRYILLLNWWFANKIKKLEDFTAHECDGVRLASYFCFACELTQDTQKE